MAIKNPKTGEMDHVNPSLVNKIIMEPDYIQRVDEKKSSKVNYQLQGREAGDNQLVLLKAQVADTEEDLIQSIALDEFENMLAEAVYSEKEMRLEHVPSFRLIMDQLLARFISTQQQQGKYFVRIGEYNEHKVGLGVILDTKSRQLIGTFEQFDFVVAKQPVDTKIKIHNIILQGRMPSDLSDSGRFQFVYYDLEAMTSYTFIGDAGAKRENIAYEGDEFSNLTMIQSFTMSAESFTEQLPLYLLIQQAEAKKSLIQNVSQDDALFQDFYDEYKQARLLILRDSQEKVKKESIVQQFADIDLDF